jgi:hypothetical protein
MIFDPGCAVTATSGVKQTIQIRNVTDFVPNGV